MKQCSFCLGDVPDAAVKCQHCGEWLEQPPLAYETPPPGNARRKPIARVAIGLGIAFLLGIAGLIFVSRATVSPYPMLPRAPARTVVNVSPPAASQPVPGNSQ